MASVQALRQYAAARSPTSIERVYSGAFVHSLAMDKLEIVHHGTVGVGYDGKILFVGKSVSESDSFMKKFSVRPEQIIELKQRLLMPGLVDTHVHAPQYAFTGTGYGIPLLEWLNKYTFKFEARFKELAFAEQIYPKGTPPFPCPPPPSLPKDLWLTLSCAAVTRLLRNGTTTAVWFATIHLEATKYLADLTVEKGQRAFIGKVNMDMNSPDYYVEKSEQSLADTEAFIKHALSKQTDLLTPVITPRFAPTCTPALMKRLGELATVHNLPIQSHISENRDEIAWVASLFPEQKSYAEVYEAHGLLNSRTIMAHGVWLTDAEVALMNQHGAGVSHCPLSNICLASGHMPLRQLLAKGLKIGLGTDVSGGYSPSILHAMRDAISVSTAIHVERDPSSKPLNHAEAFYLATLGGAKLIGIEEKIGNFEAGKDFDALVVNTRAKGSPFDVFAFDDLEAEFEKFCYLGDDRNIEQVIVKGRKIEL